MKAYSFGVSPPPYRALPESALFIRTMRRHSGLSQVKLSEKIGISQSQLSKYEQGHSTPTLVMFNRIAETCGFDVAVIRKREAS